MQKLLIGLLFAALLVFLITFALFSVEYQGHRIWLSYPLLDIDSFKNAPNNISLRQARRVERLLLAASIATDYPGMSEAIRAAGALQFTGYGSYAVPFATPAGERLVLFCVEVPRVGEDRCLLFRGQKGGDVKLHDDFVTNEPIRAFSITPSGPIYVGSTGKAVNPTPTPTRLKEIQ